MGNLNNITVNPFNGSIKDMLQHLIQTLEAGKTYNPMALDKIQAKIDELKLVIATLPNIEGWQKIESRMNC